MGTERYIALVACEGRQRAREGPGGIMHGAHDRVCCGILVRGVGCRRVAEVRGTWNSSEGYHQGRLSPGLHECTRA